MKPRAARRSSRPADVVLIVTRPGDEHAVLVALRLAELGLRPVPVHLSRLPDEGVSVRLGGGASARVALGTAEGFFDPAEVRAVWWRRPEPVDAWPLARAQRELGAAEWSEALAGIGRVAGGFWVNDPGREEVARRKIVQLEAARRVGLPVPPTLVTNDLAAARDFARRFRAGAVVKSLASTRAGGYTRRLDARSAWLARRLRTGPAIFQERVPGLDVRVTVVGRRAFAMSADARTGGDPDDVRVSWEEASRSARPARLPAALGRRILALHGALGLSYGAVDLRRRRNGDYAFLEVNPGGQFMHAEAATGHAISEALARLLATGGQPGRRP